MLNSFLNIVIENVDTCHQKKNKKNDRSYVEAGTLE